MVNLFNTLEKLLARANRDLPSYLCITDKLEHVLYSRNSSFIKVRIEIPMTLYIARGSCDSGCL